MDNKQFFYKLIFVFAMIVLFGYSGNVRNRMTAAAKETEKKQEFFSEEKELTEEQKADTSKNFIYKIQAEKKEKTESEGFFDFSFTGTSIDLMQQMVFKESTNSFTLVFPNAEYLLHMKKFTEFGRLLSKMSIKALEDGSVEVQILTKKVMVYSYEFDENTLKFQIYYDMETFLPKNYKKFSIVLFKPEGVSIRSVTNEDLYEKKKFIITIKGDHADFYKRNPIITNSSKLKDITVKEDGKKTNITVTTKTLQGYKIYEKDDFFVVKMGAPSKIYSSVLVLDAGHGGKDSGACAHRMREKDLNYEIIYTLMKDYFSDNAPEIKVYWTRKTDTFITLAGRAAFAKKIGADAFISLHINMAGRKGANGTEVYYSKSNNSPDFDGITSKKMAALFKKRLVTDLSMHDRGVKSAGFYVIKHNTVPAILIELGFLSGNKDHKKLKKMSFRKKAAKSIYVGIVQMFLKYETGR